MKDRIIREVKRAVEKDVTRFSLHSLIIQSLITLSKNRYLTEQARGIFAGLLSVILSKSLYFASRNATTAPFFSSGLPAKKVRFFGFQAAL
jgi:hypothetical protein